MSPQVAGNSKRLGIAEFLECIGNYEWSMFAVEAPLQAVIDTLVNLQSMQRWQSLNLEVLRLDVEKRTSHTSGQVGGAIPVVEVHGWTCVPWTACWYMEDIAGYHKIIKLQGGLIGTQDIKTIPATLSNELQTRVVTFFAEDTDGLIGYQIFDSGESVEHFVHVPASRLFWQSQLHEDPENNFDQDEDDDWEDNVENAPWKLSLAEQFVNNRFHELEIYIPDCYAVRREDSVWLEGNFSLNVIGRAAVLQYL